MSKNRSVVLKTITQFKSDVEMGGMTFDEYKSKSRKIKIMIDLISEEKMKVARCLLFMHKIEMNQYLDLKMRIDRSRLYYKRLLSSC